MGKRGWTVALALLAGACGDGPKALGPGIPMPGGDGGGSPSDVPLAEVGPGGTGEVRLQVLSPAAQAVLGGATTPEIRARVHSLVRGTGLPSPDVIVPDSVRFFIATDDPKGPAVTGLLTGPSFDAEYAARADLTPLPTGRYWLTIAAATRDGSQGSARIEVLVDAGPRITILTPADQGAYKGSVAVDVQIDATPFELGPAPEAFVGSMPVPLEMGVAPGRFRAVLEFNKFMPPLIDDQLFRVRASNRQGTPAEARVIFVVDDDGPLFSETQPGEGQVVGGVVRIAAKLSDRAGVLGPSVTAFIGNRGGEGFELELKPEGTSGVYSALFDTRKFHGCTRDASSLCNVWPNLSFRASDLLGNERVVAYDVGIDNQPPLIDLDPPDFRVAKFSGGWMCSHAFDPVGSCRSLGDMPNDLAGVGQVFDLRARIEDQGNHASGLKGPPLALVDPATVVAYVLDDTSQPLAVDSDGDGNCDAVNPKLVPTTMPPQQSNETLAVRLVPVPVKGAANFTEDPTVPLGCLPGDEKLPPPALCRNNSLSVAIGYPGWTDPEAAIWSVEPVTTARCAGGQFDDYANRISEGWACIAVVATDRVGNSSVSPPLRVYIDYKSDRLGKPAFACPVPPADAPPAPNCTGRYDRATGNLLPGICKPFGFKDLAPPEGPRGN